MKLYLVVRDDLSPGRQAAQLCHAHRAFVAEHPETELEWFEKSNTVVCLAATPQGLAELVEKTRRRGVPASVFREPDLGDVLTAVAIGPTGKSLCRRFSLVV